jgi:hypothetical protein
MPGRTERGGDAFVLVRLNPPQGRTRRPGGRPPGCRRRTDQPAARGAARRGAGGARTSRQPGGPPVLVPAAPDQPSPPTPPLPSPRNAGAGIPLAETYPAPRAAANNLTGNYRQHPRAASGGGCARIDAGARRARSRQPRLRGTTPTLGTARTRAGAPLRLNLARGSGPRLGVLVSGRASLAAAAPAGERSSASGPSAARRRGTAGGPNLGFVLPGGQ